MASKLTIEDQIELILMYARHDSSLRGVAAEFNRKHPDKHPITHATVKVFKRFRFRKCSTFLHSGYKQVSRSPRPSI